MNIAIGNSGIRPLHSVRRHIRQAIAALCVGLICLSVGVRISGGAAPASSSSEPSFQSIPAIVLDYQAGEREGLVRTNTAAASGSRSTCGSACRRSVASSVARCARLQGSRSKRRPSASAEGLLLCQTFVS